MDDSRRPRGSLRCVWSIVNRRRLLSVLALAGAILLLLLFRAPLASIALNNYGSILLNRALLTPDLGPDERTELGTRAGGAFAAAAAWSPASPLPYFNLAAMHSHWGDGPSAARALARAVGLSPDDISARFAYGEALAAIGDEPGAREEWRAAQAEAYFITLARLLAQEGDSAGALTAAQRAVAVAPNSPDAYERLGQTLAAVGRRDEAISALEQAAALEPEGSARRYVLQAEVHTARQEWVAALTAYGRAAALDPADPAPHHRMGNLLQRELDDVQGAIDRYRWALALEPGYSPSRLALGRLYGEGGDCQAAIEWLMPLFEPEAGEAATALAHFQTGSCLTASGRPNEGIPHLQRAAALRAESSTYLRALAKAYGQAGMVGEAIEAWLRLLEMSPGDGEAERALGELGWEGSE
jgi:tetratricopeptide (TPR) repeat protein